MINMWFKRYEKLALEMEKIKKIKEATIDLPEVVD